MTFNEKLVRLRKQKGLTQDEFASAVGVSRQAVYKWESGQSYPEVPKLLEMKALFGISIDDLLDESYEVALPEKKRKRAQRVKTESPAPVVEAVSVEAEPIAEISAEEIVSVAEPALIEEPAPTVEHTPVAESAPIQESAPAAEPTPEAEPEAVQEPEKRRGFFSRLFGRK